MSAELYDLVLSLLGSTMAVALLFGLGVLIGWLVWRKTKTRALEKHWETT